MATAAKRGRPPNLTLQAPQPAPSIELESPHDDEGLDLAGDLSLDSPGPLSGSDEETDITKSLERLEQLRQNVQKNLRLRPIRSNGSLPKVQLGDTSPWDPSINSPQSSISSYFTPAGEGPLSAKFIGSTPPPVPQRKSQAIEPGALFQRLSAPRRPLLIDTRPPAAHLAFHIRDSINLAIPSLILKRSKKTPFQSLDTLRQYITTEKGKRDWDILLKPGGPWDNDIVVYSEDEDKTLLPVLSPLLSYGTVDYLQGGISSAGHHPDLQTLILSDSDNHERNSGLFQLDTDAAFRSKSLPEIDSRSSLDMSSLNINLPPPRSPLPPPRSPLPPPRSPLPLMSSIMSTSVETGINIVDGSPSPPPSQAGFRRPPPPPRRPSAPNLRKLDTKSAERLKLSVRPVPSKSLNSLSLSLPPPSPHPAISATSPSTPWSLTSPISGNDEFPTAYYTPPHTPGTPKGANGFGAFPFGRGGDPPATARPDDPPTTEEPMGEFAISTILPHFLFLGPELTNPEHVTELQALGVKRILNIAIECDADDHGLRLREEFERYNKIPMRDTVEEENIARGVREVCEILDDARLHSAATYVHCKAGKSRSVTAVMAYLIHANHWTLSRAYAFVLERRKGISPNIGFVSELMTFEEEELGGKSVGVQPSSGADGDNHNGGPGAGHSHNANYGVAAGGRRGGHIRESLPPAFSQTQSFSAAPDNQDFGPGVGGGMSEAVGNAGQEMEVRDAAGRYRHARRAPVDENTLQPMRRVSKAGLESSAYGYAGP
ncbi:hypothetical protein DFH08DRAFT_739291 [Mycena albidolilacea]|uniref:protein-tyrosine-phosphatase n=1 Tax=Mycena albidolilacea TaxID=1033008 RepID=A0AAD7EVH9_9AGAR|nr:hypothetical protein DFH08DRAFT_739291 [Mycena albidolilacea]